MTDYAMRYPRKIFVRSALKPFTYVVMSVLSQITVNGRENFPKKGPLILVGNHVAMVETMLMALYAPYNVEMIGAGDIPLDKRFAPLMNMYGFIPVKRGSMDRAGMNMALDVLKQNGVLGIFPEGGIWETSVKDARTGVAWLSNKGNTPILPMGFGGLVGAVGKITSFKRPKLTVNVGELIPPISVDVPGKSRKEALEDGANMVMERIEALIPADERKTSSPFTDERFDFECVIQNGNGDPVTPPADVTITYREGLGKFFHRPVLLDVLARNLQRPVEALQRLDSDPAQIAAAAQEVLNYLRENPQFLNYRFGYDMGGAMLAGVSELKTLADWAARGGYTLHMKPIRRYRMSDSGQEVVEDHPAMAHSM